MAALITTLQCSVHIAQANELQLALRLFINSYFKCIACAEKDNDSEYNYIPFYKKSLWDLYTLLKMGSCHNPKFGVPMTGQIKCPWVVTVTPC